MSDTTNPTDEEVRAATREERRALADLLTGLPPEGWDAPTLCAGWRVREVVAHITMAYRYSLPQVVAGMVRARGSFNRMADRAARRDAAELTPEQLTASAAGNIEHPWKPPGGGLVGALSHDTIHGLDITEGLGTGRTVPIERVAMVLRDTRPSQLRYFGVDLAGVRLVASDLDWSLGTGSEVSGRAQDLLLVICGRGAAPGRLDGREAGRFTR